MEYNRAQSNLPRRKKKLKKMGRRKGERKRERKGKSIWGEIKQNKYNGTISSLQLANLAT